jgi:hypothetical protein
MFSCMCACGHGVWGATCRAALPCGGGLHATHALPAPRPAAPACPAQIIIVDNSPHSYVFQPANAVPIGTFIDNMEDQELLELLPVLNEVERVPDVRTVLGAHLHGRQQLAG